MSTTTTRQHEPDQACADAVDLARAAAEDDAGPGEVGAHVGIEVESDRVVTHQFACLSPAYVGWRWAVTVSRAARAKVVTVSESVLLPGPDSLLAPDWVPWTERVRPGDLKAGDLMPASSDDERLVPVVAIAGEPGLLDWDEDDAWRLGFEPGAGPGGEAGPTDAEAGTGQPEAGQPEAGRPGRVRNRSGPGQPERRSRHRDGQPGADRGAGRRSRGREPSPWACCVRPGCCRPWAVTKRPSGGTTASRDPVPLASAAPAHCLTCGFMVRLSGPLGRVFGVCANEFAPDDGKVVSVDHGCGAHSDGEVQAGVPARTRRRRPSTNSATTC